jgi:periplasmic protein CpxP/Spy
MVIMYRIGTMLIPVLLLVAAGLSAQDSSSSAQPSTPTAPQRRHVQGDRAEHRLMRLTKRLSLTDDQKEKLRPILQDEEKQMKAVDEDTSLTPQQKHRKMRDIHRASRSQMDSILTEEQKQKLPPERHHGGGQHHARRGGMNPGTTNPGTPSSDQPNPQ